MDLVYNISQKVMPNMSDISAMEEELIFVYSKINRNFIHTKVKQKIILLGYMVYIITMKNKSHMKVNGYITEKKELELKYIVMEVNTKVNIKMELSMD